MKLAYIDCFAGLSGETLLDALFSVGLSREPVDRALGELHVRELYANGHGPESKLDRFRKSVAASALPPLVKQAVDAILCRLREAEEAVQGQEEDRVLRVTGWQEWCESELRAAVGVVLGLSMLGIDRVECSPVRVGGGLAGENGKGEGHSRPAFSPIAADILCRASVPVYGGNQSSEFVTPVGAALATILASSFGPLPAMRIHAIGYGREQVGSNGSTMSRQTRVFVGERASVEAGPAENHARQARITPIKVTTAAYAPEMPYAASTKAESVQEAPVPLQQNGEGAQANAFLSLSEEWVALSIKGHQESGRQRL